MKTKKFEYILASLGFALVRMSNHRIWSNGVKQLAVPHDREIGRNIARKILKDIGYNQRVSELNFG